MNVAMQAGVNGMLAEQRNLDAVSQDLANVENPAYKASRLSFKALASGLGAKYDGSQLRFTQGKLEKTSGPFDLAIMGDGFFKVKTSTGETAFTRAGDFTRQPNGSLVNGQGCTLAGVSIPADATSLKVATDGTVFADMPMRPHQSIGRIRIARFNAPELLNQQAPGVFTETPRSGVAHDVLPGRDSKISFGMLERSNVSIIESMMQILAAQRSYEAESKAVQASDEMLRIANNIAPSS